MAVRKKKATASAPKAAPARTTAEPKKNGSVAVTHQDIAARAYVIWESSGRRHGNDCAHWFQAERELRG